MPPQPHSESAAAAPRPRGGWLASLAPTCCWDKPAFVLILLRVVEGFVFFLVFVRAAIASGLVTP